MSTDTRFWPYWKSKFNGWQDPIVTLHDATAVINYCMLHYRMFEEIIVVDIRGTIMTHVKEHVVKYYEIESRKYVYFNLNTMKEVKGIF